MPRRKKVRTVTRSGSQLEQLKTLAMVLAEKLDDPRTDSRNIASLARQYRETVNQIAAIEGDKDDDDPLEEIIKRRDGNG